MKKNFSNTICVDVDGVINNCTHSYSGKLEFPIEGAFEGLERLIKHGYEVVLLTARNKRERDEAVKWMTYYGVNKGTHYHKITNVKPVARMYIDDRGYRFTNWTDVIKLLI